MSRFPFPNGAIFPALCVQMESHNQFSISTNKTRDQARFLLGFVSFAVSNVTTVPVNDSFVLSTLLFVSHIGSATWIALKNLPVSSYFSCTKVRDDATNSRRRDSSLHVIDQTVNSTSSLDFLLFPVCLTVCAVKQLSSSLLVIVNIKIVNTRDSKHDTLTGNAIIFARDKIFCTSTATIPSVCFLSSFSFRFIEPAAILTWIEEIKKYTTSSFVS